MKREQRGGGNRAKNVRVARDGAAVAGKAPGAGREDSEQMDVAERAPGEMVGQGPGSMRDSPALRTAWSTDLRAWNAGLPRRGAERGGSDKGAEPGGQVGAEST